MLFGFPLAVVTQAARSTSVMKSRVIGTALRLLRAATEIPHVSREKFEFDDSEIEFPLADRKQPNESKCQRPSISSKSG